MRELLNHIFIELDQLIQTENLERDNLGSALIPKALIKVLGQTSLLAQPELTTALHLAQTGDLSMASFI